MPTRPESDDNLPMVTSFHVLQIDHVELFVPDRHEAAGWYQRVLGLAVLPEYQEWATDQGGPLMISSDDGNTKLALFEGQPQSSDPYGHRLEVTTYEYEAPRTALIGVRGQ